MGTEHAAEWLTQALGYEVEEVVGVYKGIRDHETRGQEDITITIVHSATIGYSVITETEDGRRTQGKHDHDLKGAIETMFLGDFNT